MALLFIVKVTVKLMTDEAMDFIGSCDKLERNDTSFPLCHRFTLLALQKSMCCNLNDQRR